MITEPCCDDIAVHSHNGGTTLRKSGQPYRLHWSKTWRKPRLTTYIAVPPSRWHISRNRYGTDDGPGVTIGIAIRAGSRVLSIVWAQPHATRAAS